MRCKSTEHKKKFAFLPFTSVLRFCVGRNSLFTLGPSFFSISLHIRMTSDATSNRVLFSLLSSSLSLHSLSAASHIRHGYDRRKFKKRGTDDVISRSCCPCPPLFLLHVCNPISYITKASYLLFFFFLLYS